MSARRALYLSPHQLTCFHWQAGVVHGEASFENTPQGVADFSEYLATHANSIFTFIVNLPEEGFQLETIPFLQRGDRTAVIERKLSQLFYGTPYTSSISLGYEKTRRKDERLLLAGLTGSAAIDLWITALNNARVSLAGIYSLPFLGETLLKKLKVSDERCVLLTAQDQSIRSTYFERGKLHFSRISPLTHSGIAGLAQAFSTEAVKLQQYLLSQRLIARNQSLKAIVIAHPQALPAVDTSCITTESLSFQIIGSDECSKLAGLKTPPTNSHAELLFAHIAISSSPEAQFAKEPLRHDYRLWQLRNMLYGLGAVALIGCTLFAGKQFYSAFSLTSQASEITAQAQDARDRYDAIVRTFPPIPTNNATLHQIMDRYSELESGGATPEAFYLDISHALANAPSIEITSLDWAASNTASSKAQNVENASAQTLLLKGQITLGSHATPRQILAAFESFVATLRANPKLQIKELQQPFDVDSGKALRSGNTTTTESAVRPFALEISRRSGA